MDYKQSGVDVEKGDLFVEKIKSFIGETYTENVVSGVGGFAALYEIDPERYLAAGTDGVGTKVKLSQELNIHHTIGQDLVAMCVNDVICTGARPLFFLDYLASGKLDLEIHTELVKGISKACKEIGCALIGGETAEMPGVYETGVYDLAGFCVGEVSKENWLGPFRVKAGSTLVGIASSGFHSNGYSLVRKIIERAGAKPSDDLGGRPLGDVVMAPTEIYVKPLLKLISEIDVKGMAHITGGGLVDNVPRVLPENTQAVLHRDSWQMPELFRWLQMKGGVADAEMVRVFNCGIGMVVIVSPAQADVAIKSLTAQGLKAWVVGEVVERPQDAPQTIVI